MSAENWGLPRAVAICLCADWTWWCCSCQTSTSLQGNSGWRVRHYVQSLSHIWLFVTPWTAAHQASLSFTISWSLLKRPLSWWCHPTISSSLAPFSTCLQSLGASLSLFQWVHSSNQVAKGLELLLQHQSFQWLFRADFLQDGLVWSPCSPRDSQESSPAPQVEGISSLALSLFYCPALTSVRDYWKNHSFDYKDLCRQSDVSAF